MSNNKIQVKISGNGTAQEIVSALRQISDEIELGNHVNGISSFGQVDWEDPILTTTISEMEMKFFSIHVFHNRKDGYSIPFKFECDEYSEDDIIDAAIKANVLDAEDGQYVDTVDEIDENEYNIMLKI